MIGLDTNVLLRKRAGATSAGGRIGPRLRRARLLRQSDRPERADLDAGARTYKQSRDDIADRLELILEAPEFVVANLDEAERALHRYRQGAADFADYFLAEINRSAGCFTTATFDTEARKSGDLFSVVPAIL